MTLPPLKAARAWKNYLADINPKRIEDIRLEEVRRTSWFILTDEVAEQLATFMQGKRVLEAGAGTGYLAAHMRLRGITQYDAYDNRSSFHYDMSSPNYGVVFEDVLTVDFSQYDIVVICWPPFDSSFSKAVLDRMLSGQVLVYQGEGYGGCTGSRSFHNALINDFHALDRERIVDPEQHVRWPIEDMSDSWYFYYRK